MEAARMNAAEEMEASVTGSTAGASVRPGTTAKSNAIRPVSSKYMQAVAASGSAASNQRHEVSSRDSYPARSGASMGLGSVSATPAQGLHAGRSLNLTSSLRTQGAPSTRMSHGRESGVFGSSPGRGSILSAIDTAAQDSRKEALARYKQEKAARAGAAAVGAGSMGPPSAPSAAAAGAGAAAGSSQGPRVPALKLGVLRDAAAAQAQAAAVAGGEAGKGTSARASGGGAQVGGIGTVVNTGGASGAAPLSARALGQLAGSKPQVMGRSASGAVGVSGRSSNAAANAAKSPPVPRLSLVPSGGLRVAEQQLKTAMNLPLPKDEVWDAAQVALPADGAEEALVPAAARTPSSRITKSPLRGMPGAAVPWPGLGPSQPSSQQVPAQPQAQNQQQQSMPAPARSAQPLSARSAAPAAAAPPAAPAAVPAAPAAPAGHASRASSHAEASTSDTGGRSIENQIKMVRLQELQWRCLTAKLAAAARHRRDARQREIGAVSMLIADMMAQNTAGAAAIATKNAMKRTRDVLSTQLPLLEQWRNMQDAHGTASQEVLTALQNALTSLPLVNGAALGTGGGDASQAIPQLRRALATGLASLQSAEAALGSLLHGSSGGGSGGAAEARGASQQQGGVPAMAELLPQLHETLVEEVATLRCMLANLNQLATKMDEAACLRAHTTAALAARQAQAREEGEGAMDIDAVMDAALAALGLGVA
ncbi:hypothetical protein Agub_g12317 [Astrephomene gubernaculifera]|uniref:Uncharacterized protein n=1 Tax=Astrephomene gubernaculifera TaxID=47775 RepID=A0AAD3E030_9CHLO|nr:hypothetical protein Agub_g12317 [Astrephomene gubernaculifera]